MAILNGGFTDSFDHYNTTALLAEKWTTENFISFPVNGREGQGVQLNQFGYVNLQLDAGAAVIIGFAWAANGQGTVDGPIYVGSTGGIQLVILYLESDYTLSVYSGSLLLCNSSPFVLCPEIFNYIEINYETSGRVGDPANVSVTVNVNSINIMSGTTATGPTIPGAGSDIQVHEWEGPNNPFASATMDDVYILGSSNVSPANFFGDVKIICSFPNSDDAGNAWTGSYVDIDSPTPTDSTSINTSTSGAQSTFGFENITGSPLPGLQYVNSWMRMSGSSENIEEVVIPGPTYSAQMTLTPPYIWYQQGWALDPNTGLSWTATRYNTDHFGVLHL